MTHQAITLRACRTEDLGPLESWAPTGNTRTHEARFRRQQAGTSTYYLATLRESGEYVGSCEVRWSGCAAPEVPRSPEINGLQVWPEHRQSLGIGTQIIERMEAEAVRRGHQVMGLGVHDARARALYLRLGYRDTGLTYIDRYTLIDDHHREHRIADRCQWLTKDLAGHLRAPRAQTLS